MLRHKVYLLLALLSFSLPVFSTADGVDSLRQIQVNDLKTQIEWVNPSAMRAYLDDTKQSLGDKAPRFTKNFPSWKHSCRKYSKRFPPQPQTKQSATPGKCWR